MISLLELQIDAPDYILMCKRANKLSIALKALPTSKSLDVGVDSTGLKVYGEGEWKVRTQGKSKRAVGESCTLLWLRQRMQ